MVGNGGIAVASERKEIFRIEDKWRRKWDETGLYESVPDGRKKFFATYPYSYMNGLPHIGHAFTALRVDFQCRYRRMLNYNVLFPFAFHCTGVPIVAAAKRISEAEPRQIDMMKSMGIPDGEIPHFADPVYWTRYFPERWEKSMRKLGMSIDWRRKFITTPLNKSYDSFVRWQFTLLREKNYVRIGSHPVIWCPKDNIPVGDHDRLRGEGETPTEYTLLKFRTHAGEFIITATLRPETSYGQTNLWINPEVTYVRCQVSSETWIVSRECAKKLGEQGKDVVVKGSVQGSSLTGTEVFSSTMNRWIPVLAASFANPSKGTGIVTSVPSDSPDDYIALLDLKKTARNSRMNEAESETVLKIKPIEIIDTPGYGTLPAKKVIERMHIQSQNEKEKLDAAREEVYREGYYNGTMLQTCGPYAGMKVDAARDAIKKKMIEEGTADIFYEPSGEVVCRCLTECIVKVVDNQWFLAYGDDEWKRLAHEAVATMRFFPAFMQKQFDNVIDWLKDWACVHHTGLGTELPWDSGWKIESLSDSTIYMAYYTIAEWIQDGRNISDRMIGTEFFDYVFLGKGNAAAAAKAGGFDVKSAESMRNEFLYWYPLDLRNSGKDLVGNHLTFSIFNHVALFPKELWPRSYGVNGWITISGSKMSKSAGNALALDSALEMFGADVTRITEAYADEGFNDPNWDQDFAESAGKRLLQMLETARSLEGLSEQDEDYLDRWMISTVNSLYLSYADAMDNMLYKPAVRASLLDMQNALRWYTRRKEGRLNRKTMNHFVSMQILMLSPFTPHVCEEAWENAGHEGSVCTQLLPDRQSIKVEVASLTAEKYLEGVMSDVQEILRVTGIRPKSIRLIVAEDWKRKLLDMEYRNSREEASALRKKIQGADRNGLEKLLRNIARERQQGRLQATAETALAVDEFDCLKENSAFLSREFGCDVLVVRAEELRDDEAGGRKSSSFPSKPAIFIE